MAKITGIASKLHDLAISGSLIEGVVKAKKSSKISKNKSFPLTAPDSSMQNKEAQNRLPLKAVVADCEKRWFQDALKEAKNGDTESQFLVAQMYCNGYGIPKDEHKGFSWFRKARKHRSPLPSILSKPPGFKASESNSEGKQ